MCGSDPKGSDRDLRSAFPTPTPTPSSYTFFYAQVSLSGGGEPQPLPLWAPPELPLLPYPPPPSFTSLPPRIRMLESPPHPCLLSLSPSFSSFFCSPPSPPAALAALADSLLPYLLCGSRTTSGCAWFPGWDALPCPCVRRSRGSGEMFLVTLHKREWTVYRFFNPFVNFTIESFTIESKILVLSGFAKRSASPRNAFPYMCSLFRFPNASSHPIGRTGL